MKLSPYIYPGIDPNLRIRSRMSKKLPISPLDILRIVCEESDVTINEITSKQRFSRIVDSRQIFSYIMRYKFGYTYSQTGSILDRDHATIIHSCKVHQDKFKFDRGYEELTLRIYDEINRVINKNHSS